MITIGQVAKLIAPHIGMNYPNDIESIYDIIDLIKEKIWFTGKFYGSTKWMWCRVRGDGTIITPHGYNILLGCKDENRPAMDIKDSYFMFHKNGPTSSVIKDKGFDNSVIYLGEYPTLLSPECFGNGKNNGEFFISVKSPGMGFSMEKNILRVLATDCNGNKIHTYEFTSDEDPDNTLTKILGPDDIDKYEGIIEGINFPVKGVDILYKNVIVTSVYGIMKDPTVSPVEVWLYETTVTDCDCSNGILIARLEPGEVISSYKSYKIPDKCIRNKYIYGLFKMSKPQPTSFNSEIFLTDNKNAIISIAKGIYKSTYKDQLAEGKAFINEGISALNDELRESSPNSVSTMQIDSVRDFSKLPNF